MSTSRVWQTAVCTALILAAPRPPGRPTSRATLVLVNVNLVQQWRMSIA